MSEGSVRRHPTRGAGYAEVRLPNAAAAVQDPRFRLYWEPHHNPYLGPQGWQAAEATLHPEEVTTEGRDLVMTLGPEICEHLESDTYELILPALGETRFVVPWVEIPRRPRQGRSTVVGRGTPQPVAPPPTPAPPPRPVPPPEEATLPPPRPLPEPQPPVTGPVVIDPIGGGAEMPKPKPLWPWLVGLLVLAIAAGAGWWFTQSVPAPEQAASGSQPPSRRPFEPLPPPPVNTACLGDQNVPAAQQTARDVASRTGCQPGDYLPIVIAMREAGRHDDALLLLEAAAERGVAPAMAMLARLYDPNGFQRGQPFSDPDPRQAARWYRDAERAGEAEAAAPRAALRATLQVQAEQGDTMARLTLEDFWP